MSASFWKWAFPMLCYPRQMGVRGEVVELCRLGVLYLMGCLISYALHTVIEACEAPAQQVWGTCSTNGRKPAQSGKHVCGRASSSSSPPSPSSSSSLSSSSSSSSLSPSCLRPELGAITNLEATRNRPCSERPWYEYNYNYINTYNYIHRYTINPRPDWLET